MAKKRRIVNIKVLPNEPLDGTGMICVHLYVKDERGPFVEPHVLHPVYKDGQLVKQKLEAKPTRGRLACDPKKPVAPVTKNGVTTVTLRSDDPRAVTCPKCQATKEYADMMSTIEEAYKNH